MAVNVSSPVQAPLAARGCSGSWPNADRPFFQVPRPQVAAWEDQFLKYMHDQQRTFVTELTKKQKLDDALEKALGDAITTFGGQFKA